MIDIVNKQNASILVWGIDSPRQPITMWTEVVCSVNLPGEEIRSVGAARRIYFAPKTLSKKSYRA